MLSTLRSYTDSRGVFVPKITLAEAREIYEMREVLEGLASRLFAEKATHIQKQDLEEVVNAFEQTSNRFEQDPKSEEWREKLFVAKENVYNVLFDGCRNRKLRDSLASLRKEISFLRQQTLTYPGRSKQTAQELQRILNAIKDNDAERAEEMPILHVRVDARVAYEQLE